MQDRQLPDQPYLLLLTNGKSSGRYSLDQDIMTLGRTTVNSFHFPDDDSISRQHARIRKRLGLLWLEDLGSTNGTYYTPPGGSGRQLIPEEPVLLLENSLFRLGINLVFQMHGTIATPDEATLHLRQNLQQILIELYHRLNRLPEAQQRAHLNAIRALEKELSTAENEEELALLVAEGIQRVSENINTLKFEEPPCDQLFPGLSGLPPLPDDLPEPDSPQRLQTLMNVFITDIRICFPKETGENEHD